MVTDVIVCGMGAAGYTSAMYCARAGLKTLLIGEMPGGQTLNAEKIENYPGHLEIEGYALMDIMQKQAVLSGAELKTERIKEINLAEKTVNGIKAKSIILALGSRNRKLGLLNESSLVGKGVSYCATCDGNFFRGKKVAVAGGGNTAVSDAIYLSKICEKVYIIHRRDEFRAEKKLVDIMEKCGNVQKVMNSNVVEISEDNGMVCKVKTEREEFAVSGLFVAVGTMPNTELVEGQLSIKNGICVTNSMATSVEGVYAAGDVTDTNQKQIITAAGDGAKAAKSAIDYINSL